VDRGGAQLLARVRRAAGLSQDELARKAGTSRTAVSAYEHGRDSPALGTVDRLLSATGYELDARPRIDFVGVPGAPGRVLFVPTRLPQLPAAQALATVELPLTLNWSRPGGFFGSSTGVIGLEFTNSCFVRAQRPTSCATSTACCWGTYGTASGPLRRCRSRANPRGPVSGLWTDSSASCRCGSRAQTSSVATPLLKPGSGEIRTFAKTRRLGPFARESVAALLLTL
jgi:transcriptional regulator with XRE-family HTH domain